MIPSQKPRIKYNPIYRRPTQRLKDNDVKFGSWNVRTMLQPGKMAEIADEIMRYSFDVVALQEIRWKNFGEIQKRDYSLFFSGSEKNGANGVGFYVSKKIRKSLIFFQPVTDRLCILKLKGKFQAVTIFSIYAPTEAAKNEEKDAFYDLLSKECNKIAGSSMLILLGDFNAKIGKEEFVKEVSGMHSLHNSTSDNGQYLISFATENNLWISSTSFQHRRIHKQTWKIPGSRKANQIDHVLVDRRHATSVLDVRSLRGACCDSDHYLIKIRLRQRLAVVASKNNFKREKYNLEKLYSDKEIKISFQSTLSAQLDELSPNHAVEDWKAIAKSISSSAKEVLGYLPKQSKKEWFDDECKELIIAKNESWRNFITSGTRRARAEYVSKRSAARKVINKKKKGSIKNKIKEIELNAKCNAAQFYRKIKNQTTVFQPRINICLSENGDILQTDQEILERWRQHFDNLLNNKHQEEHSPWGPIATAENIIPPPEFDEIIVALKKLRNGKASGEDSIAAELLKEGGEELHKCLHHLIIDVWEKESIPSDWLGCIIFPVHKKGDKRVCDNYRGISLLNTAYKLFTNILYERINEYAERIIEDYQCGFRRGKSTIDQCFVLSQMFEKHHEYGLDVHCLFIDFKQAFDSVKRDRIQHILLMLGIPAKLIRLVCATLTNTQAKVIIQGKLTESFPIETGVKQGDALSTVIFNLMLHFVVREVNKGGTLITKTTQICAYADDIAILSRNRNDLKEIFLKINKIANDIGLFVNEGKTKYLLKSRRPAQMPNFHVGAYTFEAVQHFKYLGVMFACSGDSTSAVRDRINAANKAYYAHLNLFKSRLLSKATKFTMYKTLIRPILTYGCEVWTLKVDDCAQIARMERKILRKIFGPIRMDDGTYRIRLNSELNDLTQNETAVRFVKAQRIRWLGHVIRMPVDCTVKKALTGKLMGVKVKGRPRNRWIDAVEHDLKKLGIRNYEATAQDRPLWRSILKEALTQPAL